LQAELGRGTFAVVYRAVDRRDGRHVALKVLQRHSPEHLERFRREGAITAKLSHPGIVAVLEAGVDQERPFVAFEEVKGAKDLSHVLPHASLRRALEILRDAALALGHAHAQGVVHRDVKPENILVDLAGQVRVADFGIAASLGSEPLTTTGTSMGTPHYMAPELVSGERSLVGPTTDVWALGVILYQVLTKRLPFEGQTAVELARRIVDARPPRPRELDPGVDRSAEIVCLRALSADPAERYADATELARALEDLLVGFSGSGETVRGREDSQPSRGGRVAAVAAGLIGVGVAVAGLTAWSGAETASPSPTPQAATPPATPPSPSAPPPSPSRASSSAPTPTAGAASSTSQAGSLSAAARATWRACRLEEARELARRAAEGGEPEGMLLYARFLQEGIGGPVALARSLEWVRRAAALDHAPARVQLAFAYLEGVSGVLDQDVARALTTLRAEAEAGQAEAWNHLGWAHQLGLGVARDLRLALDCYRRAAEGGSARGAGNAGFLYVRGWGAAPNRELALQYFRQGAEAGDARCMTFLGATLTPELQEGLDWTRKGAELGDANAAYNMGVYYENGQGVTADPELAFRWYERSASQNDLTGKSAYADALYRGFGTPRDLERARWLFEECAQAGDLRSTWRLGVMLLEGEGGPANPAQGLAWLERGVQAGDAVVMASLAEYLLAGRGVPADPARARELLATAARLGHPVAAQRLRELEGR
jgi:TPR repeat protein